jgi:hypothetical protein
MSNYWQKLQDPKWQKKRLEAMQRVEFCCELCGDSESMLQVHHKEYFKGREPWDYELNQLAVLCGNCHENHHSGNDALKQICSILPMDGPNNRDEIALIISKILEGSYES